MAESTRVRQLSELLASDSVLRDRVSTASESEVARIFAEVGFPDVTPADLVATAGPSSEPDGDELGDRELSVAAGGMIADGGEGCWNSSNTRFTPR